MANNPAGKRGVLFVLEAFRRHMDDGRWLFQRGMEEAGYLSAGHGLPPPGYNGVKVRAICRHANPDVVVMWPRYEWDDREWRGKEIKPEYRFVDWEWMTTDPRILRVAILHDACSAVGQQRRWHDDFQPDVFVTWYHPKSVLAGMPHVPEGKMVRFFHIVDADDDEVFDNVRAGCLISGMQNKNVYPLRLAATAAARAGQLGPGVDVADHPGYAQAGAKSPDFRRRLGRYKVALCTASRYKFALRKIFEASAAGCRVITDLPDYDVLPYIDHTLIRVSPTITMPDLRDVIQSAIATWNPQRQYRRAMRARYRYGWRTQTRSLAARLASIHERKVRAL